MSQNGNIRVSIFNRQNGSGGSGSGNGATNSAGQNNSGKGKQPKGTANDPVTVDAAFNLVKLWQPLLALYSIDKTLKAFGLGGSQIASSYIEALQKIWSGISDLLLSPFQADLDGIIEASLSFMQTVQDNWPRIADQIRGAFGNFFTGNNDIFGNIGRFISAFVEMEPWAKLITVGFAALAIKMALLTVEFSQIIPIIKMITSLGGLFVPAVSGFAKFIFGLGLLSAAVVAVAGTMEYIKNVQDAQRNAALTGNHDWGQDVRLGLQMAATAGATGTLAGTAVAPGPGTLIGGIGGTVGGFIGGFSYSAYTQQQLVEAHNDYVNGETEKAFRRFTSKSKAETQAINNAILESMSYGGW